MNTEKTEGTIKNRHLRDTHKQHWKHKTQDEENNTTQHNTEN